MTAKGESWEHRKGYSRSYSDGWDHYMAAKKLKEKEACDKVNKTLKVETSDEIEDSFGHT